MKQITCQRDLFDIADDIAYFNCGYNAPLLKASAEALIEGANTKLNPWTRKSNDFFDGAERLREAASSALGGSTECYAIVPSASYGMSTAARILEDHVSNNDEILVLDEAFPSNYLPWHRLAKKTGAKIITVPTPRNFDWTTSVLNHISQQTKVVAIPNCHWTNGAKLDVEKVSIAVRDVSAVLAIDITQSFGAMPFNFEKVKPDFLAASGYKWLLAPYGLSLFYAAERWHNSPALEDSWLAREGAEKFENLVNYTHVFQKGARRFDMGEKCIPTLVPGGIKALEQISSWGVENIAETLSGINEKIIELLKNTSLIPIAKEFRSPHMIGFSIDKPLPENILANLAEEKIFISQRGSALRISPHVHINDNDIDRLVCALTKTLS